MFEYIFQHYLPSSFTNVLINLVNIIGLIELYNVLHIVCNTVHKYVNEMLSRYI